MSVGHASDEEFQLELVSSMSSQDSDIHFVDPVYQLTHNQASDHAYDPDFIRMRNLSNSISIVSECLTEMEYATDGLEQEVWKIAVDIVAQEEVDETTVEVIDDHATQLTELLLQGSETKTTLRQIAGIAVQRIVR